jgi:hypothetical protein
MGIFGIGVVATVAGLAYVISRRPDGFRTTRSALLAAPAEAVFGLVNDFHRWRAWSPWEQLDPALQRTYAGPDAGVGAIYAWEGNKAGAGKMTITQSTPATQIVIALDFFKPMKANNTAEFSFEPADGGVRVTWSMHGKNSFMAKAFGLFVDVDKMVGKSFEEGLQKLGEAAKALPPAAQPLDASPAP